MKKAAAKKEEKTIAINPATGEVLGSFPINTVEDVKKAVEEARIAQPLWQALPVKQRVHHIKKCIDFLQQNAEKIAKVISQDNGKTIVDALTAEIVPAVLATRFYCKNAQRFLNDRKLPMGSILFVNKRSKIVRVPYGVVGIISPWNYPFSIPYSEIIMALLAGNAVILKTASETQCVGHILKECIETAELPPHIFTYINMPGSIAGDAFIEAGIDKLFFTGSVNVGKYLMNKASERLIPLVLELGGNDPMIVCDDADLYRAAAGAVWAGMQNAGQSCGGVERIYVDRKVYNEFLTILKGMVESLRVGDGSDISSDIGAMTTRRQMEVVQRHVDDAVKKGATIYAKSKVNSKKGQFMPCMVLADVNHDMLTMKDETFGPIVGVMPYDTIDEAIALSNDSYLGLTASVWSKNRSKAMKIGRQIKAGAVTINDHLMSHGLAETPWGGFKESGIGRTHGDLGFAEMTQPQVIVNDILPFARRNFWWKPSDKRQYEGLKGAIDVFYAQGIFNKMKALYKLSKAFMTTFIRL